MKLYLAVFIAAVTVNCLVTTINGTTATDTLTIPYIDTLLPPLEDAQHNSNDVQTKKSLTSKIKSVSTTTTSKTTTSTTTEKPITNDVNNVVPELSFEALLPPLFEAKIEQVEEKDNKQQTEETTTKVPTTTTSRTTRRPTTIKPATTTNKPTTTTKATTLKPTKVEAPSLSLEALLPPLFDNLVDNTEKKQDVKKATTTTTTTTTTTPKPLLDSAIFKTTKKSYYQQQTQHLKDLHLIDQEAVHPKNYEKQQQQLKKLQSPSSGIKTYNNNKQNQQQQQPKTKTLTSATLNNDKQVAESKTQTQQVSLLSPPPQHLHRNTEQISTQHVAKQVAQHAYRTLGNNEPKQFNYSFDFYLGSTTARPPKSGLPTITPFPHRLGR